MVKTDAGSAYFFESERFAVQFPWWPSAWTAQVGNLENFAHRPPGLDVLIGYRRIVCYEDHYELLLNDNPTEREHYESAVQAAVGNDALLAIALDAALALDNAVDGLVETLVVSREYSYAREAIATVDPELSRPGLRILDDALALLGAESGTVET